MQLSPVNTARCKYALTRLGNYHVVVKVHRVQAVDLSGGLGHLEWECINKGAVLWESVPGRYEIHRV